MEQKISVGQKLKAAMMGMLVVIIFYIVVGGTTIGLLHVKDFSEIGGIEGTTIRGIGTIICIYIWVRVYRYYVKKWTKVTTQTNQ